MPQTFTLDKITIRNVRLAKDNGKDGELIVLYRVETQDGRFGVD